MKLLPKILAIIGLVLFVLSLLIPNNYDLCHSDLSIGGLTCLPDWVFQIDEVFYVALGCIFSSIILAITRDSPLKLFEG